MPSALPTTENIGITGVCVMRLASLDSDCKPAGGNGSGFVTAGIVDVTLTPDITEGTTIAPENGCGTVVYRKVRQDKIAGYNISGNVWFHDPEHKFLMFGGTLIYGAAGGDYENEVIGHADPNYDAADQNGVYLEFITERIAEGAGDCISAAGGRPSYEGHILGKVLMAPGEISLQNDAIQLPFTGKVSGNPALYDGPWNDWPGEGYIPTSPHVSIGYDTDEYEAILATVAAGVQDLPTGS